MNTDENPIWTYLRTWLFIRLQNLQKIFLFGTAIVPCTFSHDIPTLSVTTGKLGPTADCILRTAIACFQIGAQTFSKIRQITEIISLFLKCAQGLLSLRTLFLTESISH
jgi:hypothetical protein